MNETITFPGEAPTNQARRNIREAFPYLACFCIALVFAGLAVRDLWKQNQAAVKARQPVVVPNMKASTLLAGRDQFLGDVKAPYTLVEFGDYECPPCRQIQPVVANTLKKYAGHIKLDFRQFPLTGIHPHALGAAIAAESGRIKGKFWVLHERLYTGKLLEKSTVPQSLAATGVVLNPTLAKKQIASDATLVNQLSVNGTPSFFLCRPDGTVVRLPSVDSVAMEITN